MGVRQRVQQTGFAYVRSTTKSDLRSLIPGETLRSRCALDESGGADFHDWQEIPGQTGEFPISIQRSFTGNREFTGLTWNFLALVHDRFVKVPISSDGRPERNFFRTREQRRGLVRQRDLQNFVHVFNEMYGELIFDINRDLSEILLIVPWKDDRLNSGAMSRQQLLFDSSDR